MMLINYNKLKHACIYFFLLFGLTQEATGQFNEIATSHSVKIGTSLEMVSDDYLSIPKGKTDATYLAYTFSDVNAWHVKRMTVEWSNGENAEMQVNRFMLQYSSAFSIVKNKGSRFTAYLGYSLSANPFYIKSKNLAGKQYSWAASNTLSFYNVTAYSWNKNVFSIDLSVPLLGLASRPQKNTSYSRDIHDLLYNSYDKVFFTSFHNLQAAAFSIQYSRSLNRFLTLTAGYNLQYQKIKDEFNFTERARGFNTGISYRLR